MRSNVDSVLAVALRRPPIPLRTMGMTMNARTMLMTMILGAALALSACGDKADPSAPSPEPVAAAKTEAPLEAEAPKAGTGEHVAATPTAATDRKTPEADCPFHEDKAAGAAKGAKVACDHDHDHKPAPSKTTETGSKHYGEAFTLDKAAPLGSVLASLEAEGAPLVRVSGKIHKVCKKKGCWMVVRDGEQEARVVMKGYSFTVPTDVAGRATSVEGALKVRVFNEAQVKHLAEDAGEDPDKVTGERKEYLLTANAIEIGS